MEPWMSLLCRGLSISLSLLSLSCRCCYINKEGTLSSSFETRYVIEKSRNEKARLIVYF